MTRICIVVLLSVGGGVVWAQASAKAGPKATSKSPQLAERAAAFFAAGQRLYASGQYQEALEQFKKAQRFAPHRATLFNLARCYENLLQPQKAISTYRAALVMSTNKAQRADISRRIARLQQVPAKVFVSTDPPGATVHVNGNKTAERRKTPLVVRLKAGGHVLLIRRKGYVFEARRVQAEVGTEKTVHVRLHEVPKACVACKPCLKCADPRLLEFKGLHLHVSPLGGFMVARTVGASGGPGVQAYGTAGRFRFGMHAHFMLVNPSDAGAFENTEDSSSLILTQLDAGWTFPFGRFQLYGVAGLGAYLNRITTPTALDKDGTVAERTAREVGGFLWSLGVGLEVMATKWFSLGVGLRLGMMHGRLYNPSAVLTCAEKGNTDSCGVVVDDNIVDGHHPFGSLWGSVNFHL